jgi:hypothetical protein
MVVSMYTGRGVRPECMYVCVSVCNARDAYLIDIKGHLPPIMWIGSCVLPAVPCEADPDAAQGKPAAPARTDPDAAPLEPTAPAGADPDAAPLEPAAAARADPDASPLEPAAAARADPDAAPLEPAAAAQADPDAAPLQPAAPAGMLFFTALVGIETVHPSHGELSLSQSRPACVHFS